MAQYPHQSRRKYAHCSHKPTADRLRQLNPTQAFLVLRDPHNRDTPYTRPYLSRLPLRQLEGFARGEDLRGHVTTFEPAGPWPLICY